MKHIARYSLIALLISLAATTSTNAWAASKDDGDDSEKEAVSDEADPPSLKVIKVRKNVATVVFSRKHNPLKVGQRGRLVDKLAANNGDDSMVEGPSRDHFISFNTSLSMLSTSDDKGGSSVSNSAFDTDLVYGWNKETLEYGILLGYHFTKQDPASDTRTIELGMRFDYNFKPNKVENDTVFGVRLDAALGQQDSSGLAKANNTMRIQPGVFVKWFGLSTNLAVTGELGYQYKTISADAAKTKTTGIVGSVGIETYF